jgi:competence protein ComFB
MAFMDSYDLSLLTNETEKLITEELGRQLESYPKEICTCNDCVLDMAAMALNSVKPLYRVSLLGTMYAEAAMSNPEYAKSIKDAVSMAIEKVSANPKHDVVINENPAEKLE